MKALITGGAGFIGSNLVELLVKEGHEVRVFDNLSSGHIENISEYINDKDIEYIGGDVRDADALCRAMKNIDVVYHMAASVGRQRSIDNPALDSTINLVGTVNVLEGMRHNDVHKIVYSSSAAIFGELKTPSIDEDHIQNADSPYGVSKLAAEKMILSYSGIHNIVGICLRYFNIYGKNQRFDAYGNVIPIFAKRIFDGEHISIYGDGEQTRDFVNVSDVARANYISSIKCEQTSIYNLGSGTTITINELASMMKKIANKDVIIDYLPERVGDVKHCKADASKIARELGFRVEKDLDEGLNEYISWYRDNCV
ncbi:MAG: SDR family NAD(P)-dependent oxidoreductase [Pseudobutyrivibrio sp.]|uniref:SDR family NAD(P)-dependent oxidoreductase n=1 Tax=Pseudobutyrivibrio sp. TaxID=2014367 RepID=UPI0025D7D55E|nr:SDR family NAD(P)-dependent oxidoreductase [Pseudobutyrivibrio sp.]MBQ8490570.1 SDR family NAD(P)-dependent oxidoreductase [Pseudobutyrivibrio sp.]